jgi:hypothetical protein
VLGWGAGLLKLKLESKRQSSSEEKTEQWFQVLRPREIINGI